MRRMVALLLIFSLLCSCLSGCGIQLPEFLQELIPQHTEPTQQTRPTSGGSSFFDKLFGSGSESIADRPKEVTDPLDISAALADALDQALILAPESAFGYVGGVKMPLDGALVTQLESTVLIPALFVARSLGAQIAADDGDGGSISLVLGGTSLVLSPGSTQLQCGGNTISLPVETVPEKGDILVSAAEYCSALGKSMTQRDGLVFIGDDVGPIAAAGGNGFALVSSVLQNELSAQGTTPDAVGALPANAAYPDRTDRSECLVLSADMIPYTSANGETIAVAGSLYVEDLKVEPSAANDNYYTCSMTVYNMGYTYGSVEAYSVDDRLIEFEIVKPFGGQKASVTKAITDVVVLGEDIAQAISDKSLAHLDYRSTLNSSVCSITVEVPADGYIFVTCNPGHSNQVAVYNAVHTFVTLASFAQDLAKSGDSGSMKEKITGYLVDQILENAATAAQVAMEFVEMFSGVTVNPWKPSEFAREMGQKLLTMFARCEFDITAALKDAAKDLTSGKADKAIEAYMTKLLPVTEVAFTAWDISYTSANLTCLFMDLAYVTGTRSVIIEIGDWRAAYAKFLRERDNKGGERFGLGYMNGDGIPELMIVFAGAHFGSYAEFYSYQNRRVVPIVDESGSSTIGVAYGEFSYVEFGSMMIRGNLHMGYSSTNYMQIIDNVLQATHVFNDDSMGGGSSYYYNGEKVPKFYYMLKANELKKEYGDRNIHVSAYSDCYSISEESIKEILKR